MPANDELNFKELRKAVDNAFYRYGPKLYREGMTTEDVYELKKTCVEKLIEEFPDEYRDTADQLRRFVNTQ
jgi:hypothetical protein